MALETAVFASLAAVAPAAEDFGRGPSSRHTIVPELAGCRQLVVVTAADWGSISGDLRCFERRDGRSGWTEVLSVPNAVLGRTGLAWGTGLHSGAGGDGPTKREGDGKAPAGVFPLVEAFGFASKAEARITRIPYRQLTPTTEGIDDPASRHYNRIVDAAEVSLRDWRSSEIMRRAQPYRWGAVVAHNWNQVPGAGSCIFLHVWEAAGVPTSGCTAMPEEQMLRLLRWLDVGMKPVLVQLPTAEYRRVREAWQLP